MSNEILDKVLNDGLNDGLNEGIITTEFVGETIEVVKNQFDKTLIRDYPKSNRKVTLEVGPYNLSAGKSADVATHSMHISPFGLEFAAPCDFPQGSLLRIDVSIPDYWSRKKKFVEYQRIDAPNTFRILGKVVGSEEFGKRGKKKLITIQTVNIDEVDDQVLKSFLEE